MCEHLWRPCHPGAPQLCPRSRETGRGGQARRAVPKLSLFITATETGRGRQVARPLVLTYCDHLLLHSVRLCGWVGVQACLRLKTSQRKSHNLCIRAGKCIFYVWPMSVRLCLWQIIAWKQCACAGTSSSMAMLTYLQMYRSSAFGETGVLLWHFLDRARRSSCSTDSHSEWQLVRKEKHSKIPPPRLLVPSSIRQSAVSCKNSIRAKVHSC